MKWFKVDTNDILLGGYTNNQIAIIIKYKALYAQLEKEPNERQLNSFFNKNELKELQNLLNSNQNESKSIQNEIDLKKNHREVDLKKKQKNNDLVKNSTSNLLSRIDKNIIDKKEKDNLTVIAKENPEIEKFESFWRDYIPVECDGRVVSKGSKQEAEKKFLKILKEGEDYENIRRGLQSYLQFCRRNNQLTCGVNVFLNQKRWVDDYNTSSTCSTRDYRQRQEPLSIVETYAQIAAEYGNTQ